ncbi:hypothetical protein ACFX11_012566 [Malus domestica]
MPAEPVEGEFRLGLRSGIILCNAINKVQTGAVPKRLFEWVRNCSRVHGEDKLDLCLWFSGRAGAVVGQTGSRVQVGLVAGLMQVWRRDRVRSKAAVGSSDPTRRAGSDFKCGCGSSGVSDWVQGGEVVRVWKKQQWWMPWISSFTSRIRPRNLLSDNACNLGFSFSKAYGCIARLPREHINQQKIFIEYIMFDGVTDEEQHAHLLGAKVGKLLETFQVIMECFSYAEIVTQSISK